MTTRQVTISLWTVLFVLQILIAIALAVGLAKQPQLSDESANRPLELSKTFGRVLTDGSQLSLEEQRRLLGLCRDLEGMVQTHVRLETSILTETRRLFVYILAFIGATLLLQVLLILAARKYDPAK